MSCKEFKFKDLVKFIDDNRDSLNPDTIVLLPGYNDYGVVALSRIELTAVMIDPDVTDGEIRRKHILREKVISPINAVLLRRED